MVGQVLFIDQSKADMTDPLQSRINSGIVAKLFPQAESLGAPTGNPPYIPVYGTEENITIDETVLAKWRIEFLQVEAREPTEEETTKKTKTNKMSKAQKRHLKKSNK